MGLLDKVKNMFTEEIEEEVPVKKEVMQVEIESPRMTRSHEVRKEKKEEVKETPKEFEYDVRPKKEEVKELIQEVKKEKPSPIYFDDKDFRELEKPKTRVKKAVNKKEIYGSNKVVKQPEKKAFKPTPIISPVYGILDKNYQKDEIVSKKNSLSSSYSQTISLDDVRKKAYGSLEEQETVKKKYEVTGNTEVLEDLILDVKEQLKEIPQTQMQNLNAIENELDDLEGTLVNRNLKDEISKSEINLGDNENMIENQMDDFTNDDDVVNENDLFNLIDSMYEKKDDE